MAVKFRGPGGASREGRLPDIDPDRDPRGPQCPEERLELPVREHLF